MAKKDNIIENLEANVLGLRKCLSRRKKTNQNFGNLQHHSSVVGKSTAILATQGKHHLGITKARQTVLATLSGIPTFNENDVKWVDTSTKFGSGQFGMLQLVSLNKLNDVVAVKVCNSNNSKKAIDVETVIGMTVGGNLHFPYVYGLLNERIIVMQFFGKYSNGVWTGSPTLSTAIVKLTANNFKSICKEILDAFIWLHSKKILHNDIKSNNVIVHENSSKIIDFGKANMVSSSLTYNIKPGTVEHKQYEKYHRHLAFELRNIPGSHQSFKTDTYSIGHMLKHSSLCTIPPSEHIFKLAKLMKIQDSSSRISLYNALGKLQTC